VEHLFRLDRRSGWYFGAAFSVPFIALAVLAVMDTNLQLAIGVLAVIGFAGSILAFRLMRAIQRDLSALAIAIDPAHESLATGTDTSESFWTGTR
jgi:hypothetical protein